MTISIISHENGLLSTGKICKDDRTLIEFLLRETNRS